jgi:hypothetical protein
MGKTSKWLMPRNLIFTLTWCLSLSTHNRLEELSTALHRKLLATNADLRKLRAQKHPDTHRLFALKVASKTLDQAYSACREALKETDESWLLIAYKAYLDVYQQT